MRDARVGHWPPERAKPHRRNIHAGERISQTTLKGLEDFGRPHNLLEILLNPRSSATPECPWTPVLKWTVTAAWRSKTVLLFLAVPLALK
jgi:hypothetical protein